MTTHVLDTASGRPAAGVKIELWAVRADGGRDLVREAITNQDGRIDGALFQGAGFSVGTFELVFHAGDYLRAAGHTLTEPAFLDVVPIRFGVADASAHYHVPLLISPYGYSTYRGS
ncbi:hydroxyisourate hydrolase [Pleomorphomonas sp. PLEO]|uniref:hydroxyisourate hydrolase n=1 Tax=Pleomorphomonas sp. PLEO TaxID=3239306 RepID=UPI00351DE805